MPYAHRYIEQLWLHFVGTVGIFSSPEKSKLTPHGPSFQWIGHRQKEQSLGVQLQGRNISPLYFATERVAETALPAMWFSKTLAGFSGTSGIFSSFGDFKLIPDGLSFQLKGDRQKERTLGVGLLDRNIAPLHLKTERMAETTLRASSFWAT